MLRKGPKQLRFVLSPSIYDKIIPEDHFLRKLDNHVDWSRLGAKCHHLYCENNGRPVTNYPRKMFKAEVLEYLHNWTDRDVVEYARYHLAVKWFLELELEEEPFDFSALSKFRRKLGVKVHTELFLDILRQIDEAGLLDSHLQFTDSTSIEGNVALLKTSKLIQKGCLNLERKLKEEGCKNEVTFEKKESLQKTAEKAFYLLEIASNIPETEYEREILKGLLEDYTECTDGVVTERKKKGENRIVSVTDLDVRWGAKSDDEMWVGYKFHNMMTENRFIASVDVTPANVTDDKRAIPLYDQVEKKPAVTVGDAAYGTGKNRREFTERGCQLVSPLRGQENPTKLFSKLKFPYDGETVTCPQGKVTGKFTINKRTKALVFRFRGSDCQNCPLKPQCTTGTYRTISISHYQKEFDEAAEFNATPEYKSLMKKRSLMESKYSEMKHSHGLKRARYRGLDRVTIQALLTAIVANLKNFIRLLTEAAQQASQRKLSISLG